MGRKSLSNIRRDEIIIHYYEVAKDVGLEYASVGKIADEMQISKGLVMHYFGTKESLLLALNDYILKRYLDFINLESHLNISSKQELENFVTELFSRKWGDYVDDSVFYSFYALIFRNEIIKANFKIFLKTLRQNLQVILENCKDKNVITNENINELSDLLFIMIDGAYFNLGAYFNDDQEYLTKTQLYIEQSLQLIDFSEN